MRPFKTTCASLAAGAALMLALTACAPGATPSTGSDTSPSAKLAAGETSPSVAASPAPGTHVSAAQRKAIAADCAFTLGQLETDTAPLLTEAQSLVDSDPQRAGDLMDQAVEKYQEGIDSMESQPVKDTIKDLKLYFSTQAVLLHKYGSAGLQGYYPESAAMEGLAGKFHDAYDALCFAKK
ncbi:hypothetical protein [Mycetocola saprophilus]|uniref:hypothetical protein n=1 Tax=Mycetocola saprophilus TaxID=76636 RepID=UPI0004C1FDE5|nr:hypothetical protein [Mycetocola saprophilus]